MTARIGLVGLGVMGRNLALNFADHQADVLVYNRTAAVTEAFMAADGNRDDVSAVFSVEDLVAGLDRPRRVVLMVAAGSPVDAVIHQLVPLLEEGDIIIDGGNSLFTDTMERTSRLADTGILFVGCGISGGEEGARHGPSMMPGGSAEAWAHIADLFQSVAAKAPDGTPCCDWLGPDGSGHYVKMVHNGI
ncbi:MAG: NAD(P)-binding domain-containing protein, partial [Acidimicrobiia bacterium]